MSPPRRRSTTSTSPISTCSSRTRRGACSTRSAREDPLHWSDESGDGHGFWSVTRYADIEMVNKDGDTFTSTRFVNLEEPPGEFQDLRRSILESDGTRHQALRKLLQRDFSVAQLSRYEEFLRDLARVTIDDALRTRSSTSSTRSLPTSRSRSSPGCSTCPTR